MKRILLTFTCIISVIWLFPCFVKAYTQTDFNTKVFEETGVNCGEYSQQVYDFLTAHDNYPFTLEKYSSFIKFNVGTQETNVNENNRTYEYPSPYYVYQIYYSGSTANSKAATTMYQTFYGNLNDTNFVSKWDNINDFLVTTDFENLYYDPTIPTPNFVVTLERPTPWNEVNTMTNFFDVVWNDNASYYIEIGYKYAVPNSMQVGLSDGNVVYTPLTYQESSYRNIYELSDLHVASGLNNDVNSSDFLWSAYQITDSSDWSTTVPVWANSYSIWQGKRDNWNNKLAYCMPLYGLRLEIFARYFYVMDNLVYVGAWKHWNNSYPNQYGEELPNNYQVGNSMPGYENTNNNVDYQEQTNTITTIGTQTGQDNTPTVVVNNLTPNYPDYPTVATYNHDNILLQMIQTAKQLPSFFGDFSGFCASAFAFIPSEIWTMIGFGLLCTIIVMIVKVL